MSLSDDFNFKSVEEEDEDYRENKSLIANLRDTLFKLFIKGASSEDEIEFAKHLLTYMMQTFASCVELGMQNRMLPISKIDVWCGYLGEGKKEFTYRLQAIGGEPYEELHLQRISELLENAVVQWADESWGGIIKAGEDSPMWIVDNEDNKKE